MRFDGVRCPACMGEWLRREFDPLAGWTGFKCLDVDCSLVFAVYHFAGVGAR